MRLRVPPAQSTDRKGMKVVTCSGSSHICAVGFEDHATFTTPSGLGWLLPSPTIAHANGCDVVTSKRLVPQCDERNSCPTFCDASTEGMAPSRSASLPLRDVISSAVIIGSTSSNEGSNFSLFAQCVTRLYQLIPSINLRHSRSGEIRASHNSNAALTVGGRRVDIFVCGIWYVRSRYSSEGGITHFREA